VPNTIKHHGDFTLISFEIIRGTKRFDVRDLLVGGNVFEDITSPFMTGNAIFQDSAGLYEHLPIDAACKIHIKWATSRGTGTFERTFSFYSMVNFFKTEGGTVAHYTINFITEEYFLNKVTRLRRSFGTPSKTVDGDNVVRTICQSQLGVDASRLHIEKTRFPVNFVAPSLTPVQTINFIGDYNLQETNSPSQSKDVPFIFYEDVDGFHFVGLGNLIEGKYRPRVRRMRFTIEDAKNSSLDKVDLNRIISMKFTQTFDETNLLDNGAYASQCYVVDLNRKEMVLQNFDYASGKVPMTNMQGSKLVSGRLNKPSVSSLVHKSAQFANVDSAETNWLLARSSVESQLNTQTAEIEVFGLSSRRVGELVHVDAVSVLTLHGQTSPDKKYSGKYLTKRIRHTFNQSTLKQTLGVCKTTSGENA